MNVLEIKMESKIMTDENQNEKAKTNQSEGKITYTVYGFRSASKSRSQPEAVEGYLNLVYDKFREEQMLDEKGIKSQISKLRAEVQQERTRKNDVNAELSSATRHREDREKEIEELEIEKVDIKNGDGELGDTFSFVIGAFIALLLTLYLFVFYSSSGYSAFYGIKSGSLGFINPDVFSDAQNKGGGVIALIILFPVIFLGLGFLIHNSIETNKQLTLKGKPKKYLLISTLLTITLIADIFIGYKISEGVHINAFNAGLTDETWKFELIFEDINFYLVLVLGFVVYVIWGFLLNYVLSHPYMKPENEKIKLMVENVNNKIADKRKVLTEIISKIHRLESDLSNCESNIQAKQKDIIGFENGVIPVNIASLKGSIGEFMGGWQNFTHGNFNEEDALRLNSEALKVQTNWLDLKILSLNSVN